MSAPTTFAELKTAIADWGDRDDSDIDTTAAECIALCENRLQREVRAPEREETTTLQTTAEAIDLPTDLWMIRATYLDTDPKTVLEPMTLSELRNRYSANTTGKPQNYAVRGEQLVFGPSPDSTYDLILTYTQTIPALSDSVTDNWLLLKHPDLYLHGALVELFTKYRDTEGVTIHEARFRDMLDSVNRSGERRSSGGAPIRIRPPSVV